MFIIMIDEMHLMQLNKKFVFHPLKRVQLKCLCYIDFLDQFYNSFKKAIQSQFWHQRTIEIKETARIAKAYININ